ncbi:hypothetical protein FE257_006738 [Aspergillus nanangensis]|uniref:Cupin type-2 domain-containing protein n=1 Tax=Aspergillus nanangensis TaxID=2582783 RepID=A0AAD4CQP5_ASPNN|nr:hypothetical protein FE257_006738 [Aspergillus nanangensis]
MPQSPLPPIHRVVTSHNHEAQAIVSSNTSLPATILPHGVGEAILWTTDSIPAEVASPEDRRHAPVGFVNDGSILRIVDLPPRSVGSPHRTISLDYVVVLRGTVFLSLDGHRVEVREGGVVVQQASMHGWDNETEEWARILCVMIPAQPPVFGGKALKTDLSFLS